MNVYTVVNTLLELNVLNIQDIERHLRILASRAVHPQVERWVMTVARNYIINLSGEAVEAEYELYSGKKPRKGQSSDVPSVEKAPEWVRKNLEQSRDIHFFDPVQVRRRSFWKNLENIVDWFNGAWCDDDPKMQRLDRISFQEASKQAEVWKKGIDENPWAHTNDSKRVETVKEFPKGWRIVRITSPIGMSREGSLMSHCVGGSGYQTKMAAGTASYYSLRDKDNQPHVTIEVDTSGGLHKSSQLRGRANSEPKPEYKKMISAFFAEMKAAAGNVPGDWDDPFTRY